MIKGLSHRQFYITDVNVKYKEDVYNKEFQFLKELIGFDNFNTSLIRGKMNYLLYNLPKDFIKWV